MKTPTTPRLPGADTRHADAPTGLQRAARRAAGLAATLGLLASLGVQAQTATPASALRSERAMTLELASRIAGAAVASCAANGHHVTAAVVDRAGQLRALQRADNAGPHTVAAAQAKAYTSASARNTTLSMMDAAQKNPGAANLVHIPGFLLLGGGVPVKAGNDTLGAVGVGGAPGGHLDEQCALAALDSVKGLLQ
jgi:uncharacterized protein GlcG (DUF336 family)